MDLYRKLFDRVKFNLLSQNDRETLIKGKKDTDIQKILQDYFNKIYNNFTPRGFGL